MLTISSGFTPYIVWASNTKKDEEMFVPYNCITAGCNENYISNTAVVLAELTDHTIIIDDIKKSRIRIVTGDGFL